MIVEVEIEAGREMLQSHENQVVMKKSVQDKRTAVMRLMIFKGTASCKAM